VLFTPIRWKKYIQIKSLKMKKLLIGLLTLASLAAQAQKNVFFDQSFWKGNANLESIKAEIAKGNSPSELNGMAMDATVYAINNDAPRESILFLLSQAGNDADKLTHDGRTYLFWAASKGNVEVMEYLLKKGAKVNLQDSHGYTPLTFAATSGQTNTKVYDLILQYGANLKKDLNHDGANALLIAIPNDKDFKLTDYFVAKGLSLNSVDAAGNTAFNYAARRGDIDLMNKLIQKGVKFNDNAMIMASQGTRRDANGLDVYKYLEGLNIKPNAVGANGENVLSYIGRRPKQEEIINYFIGKGVDVNRVDNEGNTALMNAAASNRDLGTIELLLSNVKDINLLNKKGVSALAMAVRSNSVEVVDLLIQRGADLKVVDANGDNLAYYLLQAYSTQRAEDFESKFKLLTSKGFDITALQKNGNSLYHLAVAKGDLALIKRIESLKIDVNLKNKDGFTALHKAVMTAKDTNTLKYLLSIGAKKDLTTDFKETTYELAAENEYLSKNNISIDFLK
jgi:ankyrin repeat protein